MNISTIHKCFAIAAIPVLLRLKGIVEKLTYAVCLAVMQ